MTPHTLTVLRDSWPPSERGCWHWSVDAWESSSLDGTPRTLAEGHSATKADAWVDGRLAATHLGLVVNGGDEVSGYELVERQMEVAR